MRLLAEGKPLELMSVDIPSLGPHSALVKIEAAGVCHTDIHLVSGTYDLGEGRRLSTTGGGSSLPLTPGHEISGRVETLGSEADGAGFKLEDEVIVFPWIGCGQCRNCISSKENLCEGRPSFLGFQKDGGYAEYVLVPDVRYLVRSGEVDPAEAAILACSGLTAFSSIKKCSLAPDDLVLIIGAGGLGTTAIQLAKKMARVKVAVADVDESKLDLASSLGADEVFNTTNTDAKALLSTIRGMNKGRGADAVVDFVGIPSTFSLGLRLLGHGGRLVSVGLGGGSASLPLPILPLYGAEVRGNFTGSLAELRELVAMMKQGTLAPVVAGSYRLEEANDVLARLKLGKIRGRAVLVP